MSYKVVLHILQGKGVLIVDNSSQMISIRLSDDVLQKLKKYSENHGETMSDSARKAIENLLSGINEPGPEPPSNISQEILEIKKQINFLSGREEDTRRYVGDLSWRLNEVQGSINNIIMFLVPYFPAPFPIPFPQFPVPPWVALADAGDPKAIVEKFWAAFSKADYNAVRSIIDDKFEAFWPNTHEKFSNKDSFIKVNELYPGKWKINLESIESCGNKVITTTKVTSEDRSFYAVSFFDIKDEKICRLVEYWGDCGDPPDWRKDITEHY